MVNLYKRGKRHEMSILGVGRTKGRKAISGRLDNKDILRIIGEALVSGFEGFYIDSAEDGRMLAAFTRGTVWINWDIVRELNNNEWHNAK